MGLTSTHLDIVDLSPRIGSQIRTDLDTLLSGREAATIREILERRGVVFFRGLDISDDQQVAIANTLGELVCNEGDSGIYKISLDKNVNQRAEYLKGSMFWHFDGSLQPYPNLATLLRAVTLSDTGGDTEFCNTYAAYDDLPQSDKELIADLRVVHSAERSQYYVRPEMSYDEIALWQKSPTKACPIVWTHQLRPQVVVARRDSRLRRSDCPSRRAARCWPACATGRPSRSTSIGTSGSPAICSSGTTPAPCTACSNMPSTAAVSCTARSLRAKNP